GPARCCARPVVPRQTGGGQSAVCSILRQTGGGNEPYAVAGAALGRRSRRVTFTLSPVASAEPDQEGHHQEGDDSPLDMPKPGGDALQMIRKEIPDGAECGHKNETRQSVDEDEVPQWHLHRPSDEKGWSTQARDKTGQKHRDVTMACKEWPTA